MTIKKFKDDQAMQLQQQNVLKKLSERKNLNRDEMHDIVLDIVNGNCSDVFISAFLMAKIINGESVDELVGLVEAIRSKSLKVIPKTNCPLIDNCGTGGDFLNTFNISTASAIVASSCKSIAVAKHGNRSSSSLSGSADFFEYIGFNLTTPADTIVRSIETIGFGFVFAPLFHPALKILTGVRKELGLRTIFNKVGPLCNPCTNLYGQVIGVSDPMLLSIIPRMISLIGLKKILIVYSHDGMDELSVCSKNTVIEMNFENDEYVMEKYIIDPNSFGFPRSSLSEIMVKSKEDSILQTLRTIYGIKTDIPKQNVVLLNSAAALMVGNAVKSLKEGVDMAAELIKNGYAQKKLRELIKNNGDMSILESLDSKL